MGFGTRPLKKYSYSKIGFPAIFKGKKKLRENLVCTATISERSTEFIRFNYGSGTRKEFFADYMDQLISAMKEKYPDKLLLFVLDNLGSHSTSLIWQILQEPCVSLLFTPVHSPQFSPVENMFGRTKSMLKEHIFQTKEATASKVAETMFGFRSADIQKFFRRSLNNMLDFW